MDVALCRLSLWSPARAKGTLPKLKNSKKMPKKLRSKQGEAAHLSSTVALSPSPATVLSIVAVHHDTGCWLGGCWAFVVSVGWVLCHFGGAWLLDPSAPVAGHGELAQQAKDTETPPMKIRSCEKLPPKLRIRTCRCWRRRSPTQLQVRPSARSAQLADQGQPRPAQPARKRLGGALATAVCGTLSLAP